jgi:hypothetical protein
MSHFWENPSFLSQAKFETDVLYNLFYGDGTDEMPGILQYTTPGLQFSYENRPTSLIITPRVRDSQTPGDYLYWSMVDQIKAALRILIPSSEPLVFDYIPNPNPNAQDWTTAGKVLLQYDPVEAMLRDPNNPCNEVQQAMVRLWIEDRLIYAYQTYWIAEPDQVVPTNQRHDASTASCSLP